MSKRVSKLQLAQKKTEEAIKLTNDKINELGKNTSIIYDSIQLINEKFNKINNIPDDEKVKYEELNKIRLSWKQQAEEIELEYKKAEIKQVGKGAAGVSAGVAVVTLGPTAAMGIATTFGVASTGTAISTLSGAAATNAALAWLGGGALAAGGGGMAAGNFFLALAGPIGWAIAGVSLAASVTMLFRTKVNKEKLDNIFTLISKRDTKSYELAIVEMCERIDRIKKENKKLIKAAEKIETFGVDYKKMSEAQQYELGSYVNLMESSTMLLINPILGLQPKYSENDYEEFCSYLDNSKLCKKPNKEMIISLANLLYKIELDEKDKKILHRSLRKNKDFLKSIKIKKNDFGIGNITLVQKALKYKYERNNS